MNYLEINIWNPLTSIFVILNGRLWPKAEVCLNAGQNPLNFCWREKEE